MKLQGNGPALLRYATIISVQKLIQVLKSNNTSFLTIQRHNRKILKKILAKDNNVRWRITIDISNIVDEESWYMVSVVCKGVTQTSQLV